MTVFFILLGLILLTVVYAVVVAFAPWITAPPITLASDNTAEPEDDPQEKQAVSGIPSCRHDVIIPCGGDHIHAWLYLPEAGEAPAPCVIMGNGFAGTKDMGLEQYALRFVREGFAVLAFDYRFLGASEGQPRQLIWIPYQKDDWRAVIAWARARPDIDADRVALWGTSASGAYAVDIAAEDTKVAAVIAQVTSLDGRVAGEIMLRKVGIGSLLRLMVHGQRDMFRRFLRRPPHRVPVTGPAGSLAMFPLDDAYAFYSRMAAPSFRNEVCARIVLRGDKYRPIKRADRVRCSVLWQMCEHDEINPPAATAAAEKALAGRILVRRYPAGHFGIYSGEHFARAVEEQAAFLTTQLWDVPATPT